MSLRRLLGLSAAAATPVRLRRSLATAATHPPWAIFKRMTSGDGSGPGATVRLAGPPHLSVLTAPKHLVKASPSPDPDTGMLQFIPGSVRAASSDGLLLLSCSELLIKIPIFARPGKEPAEFDPDHVPDFTGFVCNPVTAELSRLPDVVSGPAREVMCSEHMGLLTRADRGHDGSLDRFAVAELQGNVMVRFLSETGEWETVAVSPYQPPLARRMVLDQHVVAFGGRLWWLDVTCGAISADPFSDRPELCFVELPRGSVLPAAAQGGCCGCGGPYGCGISRYRRLCVSEGRLRYLEVSQEEPFVLSSFSLDDEGGGWTLERRLDLRRRRWLTTGITRNPDGL